MNAHHYRLLIVDDNVSIHRDIKKALNIKPSGGDNDNAFDCLKAELFGKKKSSKNDGPSYEPDSAFQGQDALNLVKKSLQDHAPYTMAFVDMRMPPGWDGLETILRIWEVDAELQVVLCTAYSDYSWSELNDKLMPKDRLLIIKKPFDSEEIQQAAYALSEKWRLQRELRHRMEWLEKTSAEISKEIVLTNLLTRIMEITLTSSNAERGVLILPKSCEYRVVFAYDKSRKNDEILLDLPIGGSDRVSETVINYVVTTHECVIIHDVVRDQRFADAYLAATKPKSVLCMPMITGGKITSILYVEHSVNANVFTEDRIALIRMISSLIAVCIDNACLYRDLELIVQERTRELKEAMEALWGEMELAKKIQTTLLPNQSNIDGYEVVVYTKPSDEVGGDYYDVIKCAENDWVLIGDVSGHGIPAGLVMMMAHTAIRTVINLNPHIRPATLLKEINSTIHNNISLMGGYRYMTIMALKLKNGTEQNIIYSGLHQDILVYRARTRSMECIQTDGMWIGVVDDIKNMVYDAKFSLNPGDTMLLYTDGITEARDKKNNMYSYERLQSLFKSVGEDPVESIKVAILQDIGCYEANDDITFIVAKKSHGHPSGQT